LSTGQIGLFDLRKNEPFLVKDHNYDERITKIEYYDKYVISSDPKIIKIWDKSNGNNFVNLELPSPISDFLVYPKSGMIFVSGDRKKIKPYYIPDLGNKKINTKELLQNGVVL
jgi:ribosome biogenesis protein ENP2